MNDGFEASSLAALNAGSSERTVESPWQHGRIPVLNFRVLAGRAREILDRWPTFLGAPSVPDGNRLDRAAFNLEQFARDFPRGAGFTEEHVERAVLIAEAVRTTFDAFLVAHAISRRRDWKRFFRTEHLRAFLDGPDLDLAHTKSHARSFQFEAAVIAQFALSGVTIEAGEPDARIHYHGQSVGLAMKRLRTRNERSVAHRLKEGARQLLGQGLRGFVVLSVDSWLDDLDVGDDPADIGRAFLKDVDAAYAQLGEVENKAHVLGVITSGTWTRWRFNDGKATFLFKSPQQVRVFTTPPNDEREAREASAFFDGMRNRWLSRLEEIGHYLS